MESKPLSPVSRRNILRTAVGGAAFAGQAGLAPAQKTGTVAGRKFKAWVSSGFGPDTTRFEELTLLPISGRQVLVRTEASQCCYTMTVRIFGTQDGGRPDPLGPQAPVQVNDPNQPTIQGHGGVGIVEAIGPEVHRVQVGDRVIVPVTPQCGVCYNCLRGRADRCQTGVNVKTFPVATRSNGDQVFGFLNIGGLAELMVAYEESVVPVFTKVSPEELATLHCVSGCGLGTTMTLAPVEPGSNVAVWGGGPVGLSAVQGARIMGADRVVLVEPIRSRREMALKIGATHVFDPNAEGDNLVPRIKDLCAGTDRPFAGGQNHLANRARFAENIGPDYVIEAVGYDRAKPKVEAGPDPSGMLPLQQVWQCCPMGGHICTTGSGYPAQAIVGFPATQWTNGSRTHHSSQYGGTNSMRDLPRYVRLIESGKFDAKTMITGRYPLEKTIDAYREVIDRTTVMAMILVS
ncbi:MAG: alcohol dehydrogenase catalytic domain-containing protein [Bryobacteraceae bacterium]